MDGPLRVKGQIGIKNKVPYRIHSHITSIQINIFIHYTVSIFLTCFCCEFRKRTTMHYFWTIFDKIGNSLSEEAMRKQPVYLSTLNSDRAATGTLYL